MRWYELILVLVLLPIFIGFKISTVAGFVAIALAAMVHIRILTLHRKGAFSGLPRIEEQSFVTACQALVPAPTDFILAERMKISRALRISSDVLAPDMTVGDVIAAFPLFGSERNLWESFDDYWEERAPGFALERGASVATIISTAWGCVMDAERVSAKDDRTLGDP